MRYIKEYEVYEKLCCLLHFSPRDCEEFLKEIPKADVIIREEHLFQLRQAKQEVAEQIFEEIEHEAYKNEEGDLYLDLPDYLKIKKKYIGELR